MNQTPEQLGRKIKDARERQEKGAHPSQNPASNRSAATATGKALRAGVDLVSALLVGGFLGYWIDEWLGTRPLFMIVLFFLGFAAGMLNIYRAQMGKDYKIGFKQETNETDNDQSSKNA